ncbi:dorsal-ventral patterning tolloid-like protein 1 [Saccoglossus kowalevskii]|uniref:Cubilin-like n=1 Tax=Saccoglossus kowalevskii TaxID=10224 RepID=A0ABM0MAB4_SACKO|nr:PREDICTED: cubilin-like [Saccoglossus kowalevskii]
MPITANTTYVPTSTNATATHITTVESVPTCSCGCGGSFYSDIGVITSPNYPEPYADNKVCFYYIKVTDGMLAQLAFMTLSVDDDVDFVHVYDGTSGLLLATYHGTYGQSDVTSPHAEMRVVFHSGVAERQNLGFYAVFRAVTTERPTYFNSSFWTPPNHCRTPNYFTGEIKSPNYPSYYPNNQDCEFRITVHNGKQVQLTFSEFDTEECCDRVIIYDGLTTSSAHMGTYSGSTIPPIILSSGPDLMVRFYSDSTVTKRGFHAYFNAVQPIYISTTDISTTSDYDQQTTSQDCGGTFHSDTGIINSPNYPNNYPNNQYCYYYITVRDGMSVQLTFSEFDTEECCDRVIIYDGLTTSSAHMGTYLGSTIPPIIVSSGPDLMVRFYSDSTVTKRGFHAYFNAVQPIYISTTDISTTSDYDKQTTPQDCGGTFHSDTGIISSPNYPNNYPNNQDCFYDITVRDGMSVQLQFMTFDTERYCDFVYVQDDLNTLYYSGAKHPFSITSQSSNLLVRFTSDYNVIGLGFQARFNAVDTYQPMTTSSLPWTTTPFSCGGYFNGESGVIVSPHYPFKYPSSIHCYYYITVTTGMSVQLEFSAFSTEKGFDNVTVYDGPYANGITLLNGHSGDSAPVLPLSSGNSITVVFHSDYNTEYEGFSANFMSANCGGVFTSRKGAAFASPSYPRDYDSDCYYYILVSYGDTIQLSFTDINMAAHDFLHVYDGSSTSATLMGTFTRIDHVPDLFSTGSHMVIHFHIDVNNSYSGFRATYYITEPPTTATPYYHNRITTNNHAHMTAIPLVLVLAIVCISLVIIYIHGYKRCKKSRLPQHNPTRPVRPPTYENSTRPDGLFCYNTLPPESHSLVSPVYYVNPLANLANSRPPPPMYEEISHNPSDVSTANVTEDAAPPYGSYSNFSEPACFAHKV